MLYGKFIDLYMNQLSRTRIGCLGAWWSGRDWSSLAYRELLWPEDIAFCFFFFFFFSGGLTWKEAIPDLSTWFYRYSTICHYGFWIPCCNGYFWIEIPWRAHCKFLRSFVEHSNTYCVDSLSWDCKALLQRDEGVKLVAEAICSGIFNDLGSGSNVDVCVITKVWFKIYDVFFLSTHRYLLLVINWFPSYPFCLFF